MQNAEIKRSLQYLKVLKTQKQNMVAQQKELEANIARLRKNPTDRLTNDLYVFQYNKKIESLKESISSTNKEIAKVTKDLEGVDLSSLEEEDLSEYSEEIQEVCPQEEQEEIVEPAPVLASNTESLQPQVQKTNNFKSLVLALKNPSKLILLGIISLLSLWVLYQSDVSNLLFNFARKSQLNFFSFVLIAVFSVLILSFYIYKEIDSKPFGRFSDYFALYLLISAIGIFVFFILQQSKLKLLVFIALALYSLLYFAFRLFLYNKNLSKNMANKPKFIQYFYTLFKKYPIIIISFVAVIIGCLLYLTISSNIIPIWLSGDYVKLKVFMIINIILFVLVLLYCIAFSIVRLKESSLKTIDLGCILTQVASLEFYFLAIIRYGKYIRWFTYTFFSLLFVVATALQVLRIIFYKNEEV